MKLAVAITVTTALLVLGLILGEIIYHANVGY